MAFGWFVVAAMICGRGQADIHCIYIYIERERERDIHIYVHIYVFIFIYIYIYMRVYIIKSRGVAGYVHGSRASSTRPRGKGDEVRRARRASEYADKR